MNIVGGRLRLEGADPAKVRAAQLATHPIMREEMQRATDVLADIVATEWRAIAPVDTGYYLHGIRTRQVHAGDVAVSEVYNDVPYADEVERGWGVYRSGPGSHRRVRPKGGDDFITFFSTKKGHFVRKRSIAGARPQWVLRRAYSASRMFLDSTLRSHARRAAQRIRSQM